MKELIYHSFGFCGEGHPSILSMIGLGLTPFIFMYKKIIDYVKKIFINKNL